MEALLRPLEQMMDPKLIARAKSLHRASPLPQMSPEILAVATALVWLPLAWAAMWFTLFLFSVAIAVSGTTPLSDANPVLILGRAIHQTPSGTLSAALSPYA